jgi:hypothetical protein
MLKVTELVIIAPMLFEMMRPARGLWRMILRGIMGRGTLDSTQMNRGRQTPQIARDVMTKG